MKRVSKRWKKVVPLAGVVGVVSVLLAGAASASPGGPTTDKSLQGVAPSQATTSIEEIADISLAAIAILHQRCWFWDEVRQELDRLGNRMLSQERERIEAAVAAKVPRPTKAQYDRCVATTM